MERTPEPELMDDPEQVRAYAEADFSESNSLFLELFSEAFPDTAVHGCALDLGCGPADITLRFADAYPGWRIHGVDGAANMLRWAREAVAGSGLGERVTLVHGVIPQAVLPARCYEAVLSNSLLHQLHEPQVLWQTVRRCACPGAALLVMDLMRPPGPEAVEALLARHAADAPEVLRGDFRNSLHAAFRVEEVRAQLRAAGLPGLEVRAVSDRHLAVIGRVAAP